MKSCRCFPSALPEGARWPRGRGSSCLPPAFSAPQEMINEADLDGDGEVAEQEFLKVMKRRDY